MERPHKKLQIYSKIKFNMKILIISGYFPPYNAIGSVRVGKFAKFLIDEGKEIKVLTSKNYDLKNLMQEIDNKFIYETEWFDYL